jgi:hypothetical protein
MNNQETITHDEEEPEEVVPCVLVTSIDGEAEAEPNYGALEKHWYPSEDTEVQRIRVTNPSREDGYACDGPLSWFNSVQLVLDPENDRVGLLVSVADPRGGWFFGVERMPDGRLRLTHPHEGESLPHVSQSNGRSSLVDMKGGGGSVSMA